MRIVYGGCGGKLIKVLNYVEVMLSLHRVGDYVFFENSAAGPYSIRRIEELNKTATGLSMISMKRS